MNTSVLDRRDFVKTFLLFTSYSWIAGKDWPSLMVAELQAQSSNQVGIFKMNLDTTAFAALQNQFGSVRLRVTGMPTSFANIIVTRVENDVFHAVTSRCTHAGTTVNVYDGSLGALFCPNHGSMFAPDGSVIQGPAGSPLTSYRTTFDGDKTIAIEIPGLGFSATVVGTTDPNTGNKRVQLQFPTVSGIRYEVRHRASLAASEAWAPVQFATTAGGAIGQTVFTGNNARATIFVEGRNEHGFFAVIRY